MNEQEKNQEIKEMLAKLIAQESAKGNDVTHLIEALKKYDSKK